MPLSGSVAMPTTERQVIGSGQRIFRLVLLTTSTLTDGCLGWLWLCREILRTRTSLFGLLTNHQEPGHDGVPYLLACSEGLRRTAARWDALNWNSMSDPRD